MVVDEQRPSEPMKMIRWQINMDLAGATRSGTFEVPLSASEDEIEAQAREAAFNHIDWGWTTSTAGEDD